jgi:hypothetical protein
MPCPQKIIESPPVISACHVATLRQASVGRRDYRRALRAGAANVVYELFGLTEEEIKIVRGSIDGK